VRVGDTLFMDFGAPGEAKYTLGGWNTRMLPGAQVEGASTAFVRGSYGDVTLPVLFGGGGVVDVRLRAPRNGDVTLYLDGKVISRTRSDTKTFQTLHLELGPDVLTRGEHLLRVRGAGIGQIDAHETAVALDWVSVGPKKATRETVPSIVASGPRLSVPSDVALGYTLVVPEGAQLSGAVAGVGELVVSEVFDDLARRELTRVQAPGKLEVDLSALRGRVARIDLTAQGGDLTLAAPRITVPAAPPSQVKRVKNVIVYLIDTLRADHLSPFNPETRVRTPGLDALVQQGAAIFTSAHTQENWTKPSVATLLSSLFPWEHNAVTTEAVVPSSVQLLPELLQEKGFYTGAFIANGYVSEKFGFKQGWDTYRNYIREGRYSRAQFLAADALEWLDERPKEVPFFLYLHAIDPHVPYRPTAEFLSLYDPEPYKGIVNFKGDSTLLEKIKAGEIRLSERDKTHLEALYDSEISYHDVHFNAVMNALAQRGLAEDTMIVVVADHGEEFWDHGSVGHGHSVYEELLHIPMVVRIPGLLDRPTRLSSAVGLVDVMPTVLEALGEPVPAGLSGTSLLPALMRSDQSAPRVTVSGFMDGWRTVVVDGLKLIQRTERRVMLHDLLQDPTEQTDVAAARPLTTRYLRGQLGLALAASEQASAAPNGIKRAHKKERTTIDAETAAQLEALGYVGTSRP
jgi:arylsulfatase A-like enzyme